MNQRFTLAALCVVSALTLSSCNRAPAEVAHKTAATPTVRRVATRAQTAPTPRALWVWDAAVIDKDAAQRENLFAFCTRKNISTLYLSMGDMFADKKLEVGHERHISAPMLARFLSRAHARNLRVEALDGDAPFAKISEYQAGLVRLNRALDYNQNAAKNQRLDGFQWDIEPQNLPAFYENNANRRAMLKQYLDSAAQMCRAVKARPLLRLGYAIPFDFDEKENAIAWKGSTKAATFHLMDQLNLLPSSYVAIMAYRDHARGEDGTIEISRGEMNYADVKARKVKVWIGQETLDVKDQSSSITFWQEGEKPLESALKQIMEGCGKRPAFGGLAIHHWDSYRRLKAGNPLRLIAADNATFSVDSPKRGATIARQTPIRGTAPSNGARVQVAIQPTGGEWYDQDLANVGADGAWSVPGYFGGDDTPEGFHFNVRARLLRADGTLVSEQIVSNLTRTNMPINAEQSLAKPIVMGYYPSYRAALAPAELRDDRFTDIIYSFAKVDAKGVLDKESYTAFPAFVQTVHGKNLKAILGLSGGGNGEAFAVMVRDANKRAQFVAAIGGLLKTTKANGLALDWEQPEPEDKPLTTLLVRELRAAMTAANPDAKLIMVVNASAWAGRGYDGPALRDSVDYLHIMSYDFHGPWNHAGHHANLFPTSADKEDGDAFSYPKALQYWHETQGFPTDKILMGLAGYGRGFRAPDWGAKSQGDSQYPEISYADIQKLIGHGWTREWDAEAHAPWLLSDDKTQRISYDDTQSAADKAVWMEKQHLPGFFIWELTQEEVGGDNALTAAALNAWQKEPFAN